MKKAITGVRGVTLIELMIVVAILAVVLSFIYAIFISQVRMSAWRENLTECQQNLKGSMAIITSDLKKATGLVESVGACDNNLTFTIGSEEIGYYVDPSTEQLIRNSTVSGARAVADLITNLSIACYDRQGMGMGNLVSASAVLDVRSVEPTLTCATSAPIPNSDPPERAERSLRSRVEMRNIWRYSGTGCGILSFKINPSVVAFCEPPGDDATIEVKLCDLEGRAMGGTVTISPKVNLPINIQGTGGTIVNYVSGKAQMVIPPPAVANTLCSATLPGTAIINASGVSSELKAGTGVEMQANWQPTDCEYTITTSRSVTVAAGDPFQFFPSIFETSADTLEASCPDPSQQSTLGVTITDACQNWIEGETVKFSIVGDPGDGSWGTLSGALDNGDGTVMATDDGSGNYSATYNAGFLAKTGIMLLAEDAAMRDEDGVVVGKSITNTVNVTNKPPSAVTLTSAAFILKEECPDYSDNVSFKVEDECGNSVADDQRSDLLVTTDRGFMNTVEFFDGTHYTSIYTTPAECGAGAAAGTYNIYVNHTGISNSTDITIPLTLQQCPAPGLSININNLNPIYSSNQLAAGCNGDDDDSERLRLRAVFHKETCEPDPRPVDVTFRTRHSDSGYGTTTPRNGRFEDNGLISQTKASGPLGVAVVYLKSHDTIGGDSLDVRAETIIPEFGGSYYQTAEKNVDIVNSPAELTLFSDSGYTVESTFYNAPYPDSPTSVFLEVRDCDENENVYSTDSVSLSTSSTRKELVYATGNSDLEFNDSENVTLTETGLNTGVFRGVLSLARGAALGTDDDTLRAAQGQAPGGVYASYQDNDDPDDDASFDAGTKGCSHFDILRPLNTFVEGGRTYPLVRPGEHNDVFEGVSSLDPLAWVPEHVGDGEIFKVVEELTTLPSWGRAHMCDETGTDEDPFFLVEGASDEGDLIIDTDLSRYGGQDFLFVAENQDNNFPAPAQLGLLIDQSPQWITLVYPDVGNCDTEADVVKYEGCTVTVKAGDIDKPTVEYTSPGSHLTGVGYVSASADDGLGKLYRVAFFGKCLEGDCVVGDTTVFATSTVITHPDQFPTPATFRVEFEEFDSSLFADGTYSTYVAAYDYGMFNDHTDSTVNVGVSETSDIEISNTCAIENFDAVRSIATGEITATGQYKLNGVNTQASFTVVADDGGGTIANSGSINASSGTLNWTSEGTSFPFSAGVTVDVEASHGSCDTSATLTIPAHPCELSGLSLTTLGDGRPFLSGQYLLDGVGTEAKIDFDPIGDPPPGVLISDADGNFTWNPPEGAPPAGPEFTIAVSGEDTGGICPTPTETIGFEG